MGVPTVTFPRTYHLADLGNAVTRDDLVFSLKDAQHFLSQPVYLEEKVDGANLGISLAEDHSICVQNRSHFVTSKSQPQFKSLNTWIERHSSDLWELLSSGEGGYILFGEWLAATHSVPYCRLPDLFLAFDLYDRARGAFLSVPERRAVLSQYSSIAVVPNLCLGDEPELVNLAELEEMVRSRPATYGDGITTIEGVVVRPAVHVRPSAGGAHRRDARKAAGADSRAADSAPSRAKLVAPGFLEKVEASGSHGWNGGKLRWNTVSHEIPES